MRGELLLPQPVNGFHYSFYARAVILSFDPPPRDYRTSSNGVTWQKSEQDAGESLRLEARGPGGCLSITTIGPLTLAELLQSLSLGFYRD